MLLYSPPGASLGNKNFVPDHITTMIASV